MPASLSRPIRSRKNLPGLSRPSSSGTSRIMINQAQVVEAIRSATRDVFTTMLGLEIESAEPYTEVQVPLPSEGIIAVIGMAGVWIGTASICCSASFACRMTTQMLGTEYTAVEEDVLDAVAEIANMIVGNFKTSAEARLGLLGL